MYTKANVLLFVKVEKTLKENLYKYEKNKNIFKILLT